MSDLSIGNLLGPQMGPAQTDSTCGQNLQNNHDLASCDLVLGDLAIECFAVHAIQSLDVRVLVVTNFAKMIKRKKIARNGSSTFDSSILISLAILHRMVFALISHFSEYRNVVFLVLA